MLITYINYLCVVFVCMCVCVCPGEGIVALNAMPYPFHLNKICLSQIALNRATWAVRGAIRKYTLCICKSFQRILPHVSDAFVVCTLMSE